MEDRERDLLEKIKDETKDIRIPDSLEPEHVEKLLEEKEAGSRRRWKPSWTVGLAAACCVLVCGAVYGTWNLTSETGENAAGTKNAEEGSAEDTQIHTAESYGEIYEYAENYRKETGDTGFISAFGARTTEESAKATDTAEAQSISADASGTGDFSATNVRQEGVDEADVVKTDGRYLYTLTDNGEQIAIVDTRDKELTEAGAIQAEDGEVIQEFYVQDGKVVLVVHESKGADGDLLQARPASVYGWGETSTKIKTYDVSDAAKPKKLGEVTQSGSYSSSRISEGYLYLFSSYSMNLDAREDDISAYVPSVNGKVLLEDQIYLPPIREAYMYEIVTSISLEKPDEIVDSKAMLSKGGELYVSNENIYWYEGNWENSVTTTTIRRLSYRDGEIKAEAQGEVDGYINDSFSIDEYADYLRVVTTDGDTNGVYILDDKLEKTGSIEGLAKDERVYSARFFGDTGYFVTFRETDPLFSVDLSDPENPRIVGQLKIPGFSDYLHFYGEDKLLGIGMDVDAETGVTSGVKLSMFDISDKKDVKEVHKETLNNVYSTDVQYNYKAALIDADKNIIGFSGYEEGGETYFVFSYDKEAGFDCQMEERVNGNGSQGARGVYIDDVLYVVKGNIIEAYDLKGYNKINDLII